MSVNSNSELHCACYTLSFVTNYYRNGMHELSLFSCTSGGAKAFEAYSGGAMLALET